MVTIKDVARLAGVAVSTASNALNGKYGVKLETKNRVVEAARQLNYVPNQIAQGLVTSNTRNISIVVSGPSSFMVFSNPAFTEVIRSITTTLNNKGYHALLNLIGEEEELERIPQIAQNRLSEALILVGTRKGDQELGNLLEGLSIPSLVVIRNIDNDKLHSVSVDNYKCGFVATNYLTEMGHRCIGYIGALSGVKMAEERLEGYRDALKQAGIVFDPLLVINGDYYQESGLTGIRKLLNQASKRPSAICTGNDMMALGVIEGLELEGLRIPDEISLIGCDNIPNLHLLKTPLTTIANPFTEIGRLAAEKIMATVEGNDQFPKQIVLNSELRIRSSVKRLQ